MAALAAGPVITMLLDCGLRSSLRDLSMAKRDNLIVSDCWVSARAVAHALFVGFGKTGSLVCNAFFGCRWHAVI